MQAVILAAGESSRFWPFGEARHKALFKLMGKPLIGHTLEMLKSAGVKDVVIVQSPKKEIEKALGSEFEGVKISYAVQKEAKGMGHAISCAKELIKDQFFVLNPNHYGEEELVKKMIASKAKLVMVAAETDNPSLYGIYEFDGDHAVGVVEKPKNPPSNWRIVGIYLLPKEFFNYWEKVKGEHYDYELALDAYFKENGKDSAKAEVIKTDLQLPSLKYPWHLFDMFTHLASKQLKGVKKGKDVKIDASAKIEGDVYIGDNTRVFEHAVIRGPAYIGNNCVIGNNTLIRDGCNLEDGVVVGFGSEVKASIMETKSHMHSGFIGDSIVGENSRLAANFITANRRIDRKNVSVEVKGKKTDSGRGFLGVLMGDDVKTGINLSVMPGTIIGNNVEVWPHSAIGGKIPSNSQVKMNYKMEISEKK